MNKKEIIKEVVVSDRTSPITNPRTNESLRAVEAGGEDGHQGGRPSVVVIPERRRRYSSQEKLGLRDKYPNILELNQAILLLMQRRSFIA